jgi:predicted DNA-binding protein with PD1-like motif
MADTNEFVLHIHILVSDENKAVGGHLTEGKIFSTAEVFIEETDYPIKRKMDEYTGLKELAN